MSKTRAFVRYSKQGKIVPGSLILTNGSYPSGPSTWKEVPVDLCCSGCKCFTITSVITGAASYYDCNKVLQTTEQLTPGQSVEVCASTIIPSSNYSYSVGDDCITSYECPPPTTTTTAPPTTTTTTI